MKSEEKRSINGNICKICLLDESEENDPLISPCDCTGSMRFVHLRCIQNWLRSKLNINQHQNIVTIFWNKLNCELCKQMLPLNITWEGKEISLLPFKERIGDSYVILESFSREHETTGLHFIGLSKNEEFKIVPTLFDEIIIIFLGTRSRKSFKDIRYDSFKNTCLFDCSSREFIYQR